jgi:L-lactate utilization protein LutB
MMPLSFTLSNVYKALQWSLLVLQCARSSHCIVFCAVRRMVQLAFVCVLLPGPHYGRGSWLSEHACGYAQPQRQASTRDATQALTIF